MGFSDRRVLITGGSRGIGRACALAFAERGARVAINYLENTEAAEATLAELAGDGHVAVQTDVSDSDSVEGMVSTVVERLGGLDIVVNNAGTWVEHKLEDLDYDGWQNAWRHTLEVNLVGAANVSYCAVRHLIDRGGGRIINISSRTAFRGQPDGPAYPASKAGLNALT